MFKSQCYYQIHKVYENHTLKFVCKFLFVELMPQTGRSTQNIAAKINRRPKIIHTRLLVLIYKIPVFV